MQHGGGPSYNWSPDRELRLAPRQRLDEAMLDLGGIELRGDTRRSDVRLEDDGREKKRLVAEPFL